MLLYKTRFLEKGTFWPYLVDIYKFYLVNQYNYNLTPSNQITMQPFYLLQNYAPYFYYYPSIYPFSQHCSIPSSPSPFSTWIHPQELQPKTIRTQSPISSYGSRKQKQSEMLELKQEQNFGKRQEKKPAKRSIVDTIELQNRNILPNMTNVVLSYVRRINKSGKEVKRVLQVMQSQQLQQAIRRFYAYQNYLKNNVNDFIIRNGIKTLMNRIDPSCPCFSVEDQIKYNKVFRIVVSRYLDKDYLQFILSSKKMDQPKRRDHLKVRRYLIQTLNRFPDKSQDPIQ